MSERPFMQLYVSDFVGDTLRLSAELVGAYMLLLMAMWNGDGELLDDESELALVARIPSERWPAAWSKLSPFFDIADGKITHGRLSSELAKFARKSAARKEAGSRGGKAKALKDKGSIVANATANAIASSRNQNKKGRATLLDPTDGTVALDRWGDEVLFKACERIRGKPAPTSLQRYSFPAEIVSQARKELAH